jgi:molybdopterin-guanine dinucleotide biosynthesis protein A
MGTPKESIEIWNGRSMIEHVSTALAAVCQCVVIVGECRGFPIPSASEIGHLPDLHPGAGPLAGIEALLSSGLDSGYLVVACDQPLLTPSLLRRLVSGDPAQPCFFRSEHGGLDPFPGYYPAAWLPRVEEAIQCGRLSVRRLIRESQGTWVPITPAEQVCLKSVNTPAELAELLQYDIVK